MFLHRRPGTQAQIADGLFSCPAPPLDAAATGRPGGGLGLMESLSYKTVHLQLNKTSSSPGKSNPPELDFAQFKRRKRGGSPFGGTG